MTYGQDRTEGLPAEEGHSKCVHMVFSEEAKRLAMKLASSAERGPESREERKLKHQGDEDVYNGERENL